MLLINAVQASRWYMTTVEWTSKVQLCWDWYWLYYISYVNASSGCQMQLMKYGPYLCIPQRMEANRKALTIYPEGVVGGCVDVFNNCLKPSGKYTCHRLLRSNTSALSCIVHSFRGITTVNINISPNRIKWLFCSRDGLVSVTDYFCTLWKLITVFK
jgi:hypothetical protein